MRRLIDRLLAALAGTIVLGFFRTIEIHGRERIGSGPALLVVNHFNGFVDPLVVARVVGRLPRFIAKDTIATFPPVRWLLAFAGVVLVGRREDHAGGVSNESAFAACHRALARRDLVAIFPEGTTHDRLQLAPIRTGAARIALGARASGVDGLRIVPIGLTFPDKIALRARLLVRVGDPIDVDRDLGSFVAPGASEGDDNHDAVDALTDAIAASLRAVTPDMEDPEEWLELDRAAAVALQEAGEVEPTLEARASVADRIGRTDPAVRRGVRDAIGAYTLALDVAGLTDDAVTEQRELAAIVQLLVRAALVALLVGPFVGVGIVVNAIPLLLVGLVSLLVRTPVSKGTVRILASVVLFPAAWIITANLLTNGFAATATTALVLAGTGFLLLWAIESGLRVLRLLLVVRARRERAAFLPGLRARRADVSRAVRDALTA